MKSVQVYDWLVTYRGGERVVASINELFPSPIFSLLHHEKSLRGTPLEGKDVVTSGLQRLPLVEKYYRYLLPFFPKAIEQFDLREFDLVLSCSHSVAKGVLTHADQLHICCCLTPMRYAWDLYWDYVSTTSGIKRALTKKVLARLRQWDFFSASSVDHFIAISKYVARRIKKAYGRDSCVIYPPVDTHLIAKEECKDDYYLAASRMVPYKNLEFIVEAFSMMPEKRLVVVGDGPEMANIKAKAKKNIEIVGYQSDVSLRAYLRKAKAFVFAAIEDFGVLPVEAQAAGTPVIALGKGSVLETVIEGETGLFFYEKKLESLIEAVEKFEHLEFSPLNCWESAQQFSAERFKIEYSRFVMKKWEEFSENRDSCRRKRAEVMASL